MTARKLIRGREAELYTDWDTARRLLRIPTETTKFVYIGPNGLQWDLSGRHKGRQGVYLANEVQGAYHLQFDQLFTEGAYQMGATYERTNYNKRLINLGVHVIAKSEHAYRMIEANWWDSWPPNQPGWLGCHTPYGGWRWCQVMLAKTVDTAMKIDPTAMDNNLMTWDMQVVAPRPWWAKPMLVDSFTAHPQTVELHGFDEKIITIANRGNLPSPPKFLYTGPGKAWVQDGMTDKMIPLPALSAADGYVQVDTDTAERTFKSSTEPVDNVFYQLIRQSQILDFFLHDQAAQGLPVWRRANGIRFQSEIPPRTVANLRVRHDTPGGQVIVFMPQRYSRPS